MASNADSGGYDYKFVEEPSNDLKCSICLRVARDPLQHGEGGCGKIFCRHCITEYKRNCNNCPNCRVDITTLFKDVRSERDIQSLKVRCENEGNGCEWVDELRSLEDHLETCDYVLIPCPNECDPKPSAFWVFALFKSYPKQTIVDNKVNFFRKDLQAHLKDECPRRQCTCPRCEEIGEYRFITSSDHCAECPKVEIQCPHASQCQAKFLREDKHNHLSTCLYEKVPCKYKDFGCEVQPLRKDLKGHENNDQKHLHIIMDTVIALKNESTELKSQLYKGYKMTININANGYGECEGTHISIWAYLMKGEYDKKLKFPFKGTITFELLNQLEDKNHHRRSCTYDGTEEASKRVAIAERADSACGVLAFIPHTDLELNVAKNCQYLKDNCLVFRIYVEVPSYKPWLQCTA